MLKKEQRTRLEVPKAVELLTSILSVIDKESAMYMRPPPNLHWNNIFLELSSFHRQVYTVLLSDQESAYLAARGEILNSSLSTFDESSIVKQIGVIYYKLLCGVNEAGR